MGSFLDKFPQVGYDINKDIYHRVFQRVTNITFRVGVVKSVLSNIGSYYEYTIGDETPEILADKFYNNPELHWVILYANDIYDPQYDWPLNYDAFRNYLVDKYRSMAGGESLSDSQIISWTQDETPSGNSIHHFEKVIERTESASGIITTDYYTVNKANLISTMSTDIAALPYDTYDTLPDSGAYVDINFGTTTTTERTYRRAISYYTYEDNLNESKRNIKIIRREYISQIAEEFDVLTGIARNGRTLRRLV